MAEWRSAEPALTVNYPRCTTGRETEEENALEWVSSVHLLFEAMHRHASSRTLEKTV